MIELLILYKLSKKVLTMYGISKDIHEDFSVLTTPSYGTIKPALNRLEKLGTMKTQKTMSSGGRPSTYYSITQKGVDYMKELLWDLFKTTGKIEYYIKYKEVLKEDGKNNLEK